MMMHLVRKLRAQRFLISHTLRLTGEKGAEQGESDPYVPAVPAMRSGCSKDGSLQKSHSLRQFK
jgi:hypothetical protein